MEDTSQSANEEADKTSKVVKTKTTKFFLNDTGSDLSSSNSEDGHSHTHYLLQQEKAKKQLQQKAMMLAAKAEAAKIISGVPPSSSASGTSGASTEQQPTMQNAAASMLMQREEIISQIIDPATLNQLYEVSQQRQYQNETATMSDVLDVQTTGGKMILPQRDQLHKRLQSVQSFVENFCIKPIQKESRNALNNATTEEKKCVAQMQARQAAQLTQDFQEASALGEMLAPLSRTQGAAATAQQKPQQAPTPPSKIPNQTTQANAAATQAQPGANMSNECECGAPAKFFQLQSGKHVCEKCILNEIYAEESYEDVYLKVLNKMQNIMRLRMKQLQSYKADYSNRQQQQQQQPQASSKPTAAQTNKPVPVTTGVTASNTGQVQQEQAEESKDPSNTQHQPSNVRSSKPPAQKQTAAPATTKKLWYQQTGAARNTTQQLQQQQAAREKAAQQAIADVMRQEQAMTQQANLMYDLLHIEIEKIRRKSISQIQQKFKAKMQQEQQIQQQQMKNNNNQKQQKRK